MRSKIVAILGSTVCLLAIQGNADGMEQGKYNDKRNSFTVTDFDKCDITVATPNRVWLKTDNASNDCWLWNARSNNAETKIACSFVDKNPLVYIDLSKEGYRVSSVQFEKNDDFWQQRPVSLTVFGSTGGYVNSKWVKLAENLPVNYAKKQRHKSNIFVNLGTCEIGPTSRSYQHYRVEIHSESGEGPSFSKIIVNTEKQVKER